MIQERTIPKLLTVAEAADRLNVRVQRVHEMIRDGYLPAVRLGRQVRVDPRKLEEWIARGGYVIEGEGDASGTE